MINGGINSPNQAKLFTDKTKNTYFMNQITGTTGISSNLGLSYTNTVTGNFKDISIIKFDSMLIVKNTYVNSTPEIETLEQAYLSENVLFFSGFLSGTAPRRIGNHKFYNITKNSIAPFTSYILTDQMQTLSTTSALTINSETTLNSVSDHLVSYKKTSAINVDPNPFIDQTEIVINDPALSRVDIVNSLGMMLSSYPLNNPDGYTRLAVDGRNWTNGVYFIQLSDKNGRVVETKKLMKF